MKYEVLRPCVVRSPDGKSATHYRKMGTEIDANPADARLLVEKGYLKEVKSQSAPAAPAEKPKDTK